MVVLDERNDVGDRFQVKRRHGPAKNVSNLKNRNCLQPHRPFPKQMEISKDGSRSQSLARQVQSFLRYMPLQWTDLLCQVPKKHSAFHSIAKEDRPSNGAIEMSAQSQKRRG